jgi:chorismate mutase
MKVNENIADDIVQTNSQQQHIDDWRKQINLLDAEIVALIAKRHAIVKLMGEYKLQHGLPIVDAIRESELKLLHDSLSVKYNIPVKYIIEFFDLTIQQSKKIQEDCRLEFDSGSINR